MACWVVELHGFLGGNFAYQAPQCNRCIVGLEARDPECMVHVWRTLSGRVKAGSAAQLAPACVFLGVFVGVYTYLRVNVCIFGCV